MSEIADLVVSNHRRQRRIAIGASFLALVLSVAPSHERALFVVRDPGVAAFSAVVPTPQLADLGRSLVNFINSPGGSLLRRARVVGGGLVPPIPYLPTVATEPESGLAESTTSPAFGSTVESSPLTLGDPLGFLPAPPFSFGPPGTSPVGVTQQSLPEGTVPGVPEPATWLMLIIGFFGIGAVLRRRNLRLFETDLVASEGHSLKA